MSQEDGIREGLKHNESPTQIPYYDLVMQDPEKNQRYLETYERRKELMKEKIDSILLPIIKKYPQIGQSNTVDYIVCGSYTYLLCAVADSMRLLHIDTTGHVTEKISNNDITEETKKSFYAFPGDIDIVKFPPHEPSLDTHGLIGENPDVFEKNSWEETIAEYTINGEKILANHPLQQFVDTYSALTGALGQRGALENSDKRQGKILRFENALKSLLRTYPIELIAKKIIDYIKQRKDDTFTIDRKTLTDPQVMKEFLEGSSGSFIMDQKIYGALLTLMQKISEEVKKK